MSRKGGYRSYVDVESIPVTNTSLVSNGECAGLVQHYTRVGPTSNWVVGDDVKGNATIKRGAAIATFLGQIRYPNKKTGNHAALYVSQNSKGIKVVEQFAGLDKPRKRTLSFKGKNEKGEFVDPSNNGDAFSIIELKGPS